MCMRTFLRRLLGHWPDVVGVDPFNKLILFEGLDVEGAILGGEN